MSGYANSQQPGATYTPYTGTGQSRFGGQPYDMAHRENPVNGPTYQHRPLQSQLNAQQAPQQQYQQQYQQPVQPQYGGNPQTQGMFQNPQGQFFDPSLELERYLNTYVNHVCTQMDVVQGYGNHIRQRLWSEAFNTIPVIVDNFQNLMANLGNNYTTEYVCELMCLAAAATLVSMDPNANNLAMQFDTYGNGLYRKMADAIPRLQQLLSRPQGYGHPQNQGFNQPQNPQGGFGQGNNNTTLFTTTKEATPAVVDNPLSTAKRGGLWQLDTEATQEQFQQPVEHVAPVQQGTIPGDNVRFYDDSAHAPTQAQQQAAQATPVQTPRNNAAWSGGQATPTRAIDEPLQMGSDPVFNQALEQMYHAASAGEAQFQHKQWQTETANPTLHPEFEILNEDQLPPADVIMNMCNGEFGNDHGDYEDDGIMEDMDDFSFDPTEPHHTVEALDAFQMRLAYNKGQPINGWKLYDPRAVPKPRYPINRPFPTAHDVLTQKRFLFVNSDNIIIELIKVKTMEMSDHIDDDLSVRTEGSNVNIAALLAGIEPRMNIAKNRKEVKEDKEKGITAKVATADQKAFNNTAMFTTSEEMSNAFIAQMEDRRDTTIEGYHDRRLTPVYMGAKGVAELEKFNHLMGACSSFKIFASKLPEALDRLPRDFEKEFRARLTAYFNDMVQTRLGANYECDDFFVDFEEMVEVLNEELGERTVADKLTSEFKRFARFAKTLPRSSRGYTDVLGTLFDNDDFVVFVTQISTLTVPFTSEEAGTHLPTGKTDSIGVNESDTPRLYGVLHSLVQSGRETYNGDAHILRLITRDDRIYYVDVSAFAVEDDVIVVSTKNNLAKHVQR